MREIKFRAWDGEAMYPANEVGDLYWFEYTTEGLKLAIEEQHFETGSGEAVEQWRTVNVPAEFMQYTTLKDKNNKEIYEGDVVKNNRGETSIVEWGCFPNMAGFQVTSPYINIFDSKSIEVIGNIFENPELI